MANEFETILDSLPPGRRRSKLEPYAKLIRALRARGRSYREIVTILRERCGLRVAVHTVYHIVRVQKGSGGRRSRRAPPPVRRASKTGASSSPRASDVPDDVWARIAAAKQRTPASPADEPKAFAYDENEPLQLMPDSKPRKR